MQICAKNIPCSSERKWLQFIEVTCRQGVGMLWNVTWMAMMTVTVRGIFLFYSVYFACFVGLLIKCLILSESMHINRVHYAFFNWICSRHGPTCYSGPRFAIF